MQTFLPYKNFLDSARALDMKRCWKQAIEAHQIIDALEGKVTSSWTNHPAVKMWEGHVGLLKRYFNSILYVCLHVHCINTKYTYYDLNTFDRSPWWLGNEDFHRAMRARLIEKDESFYLEKFPHDKGFNGGKYLWPDMVTKTFRVI